MTNRPFPNWVIAVLALLALPAQAQTAAPKAVACPALLAHTQPRLQDERPVNLCDFSGKVLLVVNTASYCGYTGQYKGLEALHAKYKDRGLVVLGIPSNDFGSQEPGSNQQIADFCENTFGVKFPMLAKSHVLPGKGGPVNPLIAGLTASTGKAPGWNFHKYLVDRRGLAVASFGSATAPQDPAIVTGIEKLLDAK